jgi:hypothetical protein
MKRVAETAECVSISQRSAMHRANNRRRKKPRKNATTAECFELIFSVGFCFWQLHRKSLVFHCESDFIRFW